MRADRGVRNIYSRVFFFFFRLGVHLGERFGGVTALTFFFSRTVVSIFIPPVYILYLVMFSGKFFC